MTTPTHAPPGELVAVAVLHAGDEVLLPGCDAPAAVVIVRIIHGSTGTRNICILAWESCADRAVHGAAGLGTEDAVTRLREGMAA